MYLTQAFIENSGPLRRLHLTPAFFPDGRPKPLVLVGGNGSGKTNLLSLITDALFEAAAVHYDDILPESGTKRSWFRIVGGATTTVGTNGSFSVLQFRHQGADLVYKEKAGIFPAAAAQAILPADLAAAANWSDEGSIKEFSVPDALSRTMFAEGAYAYFPSSRSEVPFWMNRSAVTVPEFMDGPKFAKRLSKPIYIERSLHDFKQWLMSIVLESRTDFVVNYNSGSAAFSLLGDVKPNIAAKGVLESANALLRNILTDEGVRFAWLGRKSADKVGVAKGNQLALGNLDALSAGQGILLGMFGTLLRYADMGQDGQGLDLAAIEGICIVDEIDAHIHIDLQTTVLPGLIALFPNVQFVVSSHSPLFAIGMERRFGKDGFQLIELPDGKTVTSETYAEFGKAFEALAATATFDAHLAEAAGQAGKPLVYVEGETDSPYLRAAANALARSEILERCDIEWIGAKDENGQGFHTGKDALRHTLNTLRANPQLAARPVLLLFDNDVPIAAAQYGNLFVRSMPTQLGNAKVQAGVENLLNSAAITEDDYQIIENRKPNGDITTRKTLRKSDLCRRMCADPQPDNFTAFGEALDTIEEYLNAANP